MIKSMTGFSSLTHEDERAVLGVTIRSVNHRFLDLQLRMPSSLSEVESRVRSLVQKRLTRGRVELAVSLQTRAESVPSIDVNDAFLAALAAAMEQVRAAGLVVGPLTPGDVLRFPQAITIRDRTQEPDSLAEAQIADSVAGAVDQALADLDAMRVREGAHLRADFESRLRTLAELIARLASAADIGRSGVEARLTERVRDLGQDLQADPVAIAQEIVRVAARSDISEEVTRFRAHLAHWQVLSDSEEACGRKLDFLLQEMNREVNTIGSKADGLHVSELVIDAKAELEKLREQVQNVE